jgi:predicted ArsR family transcriptional regulator
VRRGEPVGEDAVGRLCSLDDPLRRWLYDYVCEQRAPVSREQASAAANVGRTLAAYHLDKLAEAGLLSTDYQRPEGRQGPGAGRPAKLYARAEREFSVSVPPRDYELLANLLVQSVGHDPTGMVRNAVGEAAEQAGRDAAITARSTRSAGEDPSNIQTEALRSCGYQPSVGTNGEIELRNCPFHRVAQAHQDIVCGINLRLIEGLIEESGGERSQAALVPLAGRCCVVIHAAA